MKKLQNNYTTPEQSKRLLELGVPTNSADCFYSSFIKSYPYSEHKEQVWQRPRFITEDNNPDFNATDLCGYSFYFPCWSVGRLIEISRICSTLPDEEWMFPFWKDQEDNIEWSIRVIESGIRTGNMDFSKLEN